MQKKKAKAFFTILNDQGLHTRPSTELVKCVANYQSHVQLTYRNFVANGKSILGILMLAAEKGAKIAVEATGDDADEAIEAILRLAANRFNIKY
ncbi:MAG: phosphocarrier protein HPr [Chlamydiota bacterium]